MQDGWDDGYVHPADMFAPAEPIQAVEAVPAVAVPREQGYLVQLGSAVLQPSENLALRDGSHVTLALRVLADLLEPPQSDGSRRVGRGHFEEVEMWRFKSQLDEGRRVVWDGSRLWGWDRWAQLWVEIPLMALKRFALSYEGIRYGDANASGQKKQLMLTTSIVESVARMAETMCSRGRIFDSAAAGVQFLDWFIFADRADGYYTIGARESCPELYQRYQYPFRCPDLAALPAEVDDPQWAEICPPLWHVLTGSIVGSQAEWLAIQQRLGLALFGMSNQLRGSHLWFVGPPSTGKNTLMGAFAHLFPLESQTAVDIANAPRWETATLSGSRVNWIGEVDEITQPAFMKDASSDSLLMVRDTGEKGFTIKPRFLCMMGANHPPKIRDRKAFKAILSRFHFVKLRPFKGPPRPDFGDEMRACQEGLVAWALAGYLSWCRTGELEQGTQSGEVRALWLNSSSPAGQWLIESLEPVSEGAGQFLPIRTAWDGYLRWCDASNISMKAAGTIQGFQEFLESAGIEIARRGKYKEPAIVSHKLIVTGASKRSEVPAY